MWCVPLSIPTFLQPVFYSVHKFHLQGSVLNCNDQQMRCSLTFWGCLGNFILNLNDNCLQSIVSSSFAPLLVFHHFLLNTDWFKKGLCSKTNDKRKWAWCSQTLVFSPHQQFQALSCSFPQDKMIGCGKLAMSSTNLSVTDTVGHSIWFSFDGQVFI